MKISVALWRVLYEDVCMCVFFRNLFCFWAYGAKRKVVQSRQPIQSSTLLPKNGDPDYQRLGALIETPQTSETAQTSEASKAILLVLLQIGSICKHDPLRMFTRHGEFVVSVTLWRVLYGDLCMRFLSNLFF